MNAGDAHSSAAGGSDLIFRKSERFAAARDEQHIVLAAGEADPTPGVILIQFNGDKPGRAHIGKFGQAMRLTRRGGWP